MALTKCDVKVTNITELHTVPTTADGLTDATFKALFDKSPLDFKNYINNILTVEIEALIQAQKLLDNPVGHIVMNVSGTNPSTYIGGTWVAWGTGRVPVGVDTSQTEFATVELESGSKTQTLEVANLPAHKHLLRGRKAGGSLTGLGLITDAGGAMTATSGACYDLSSTMDNTGSGTAHNNLQPSITCYYFKRTV